MNQRDEAAVLGVNQYCMILRFVRTLDGDPMNFSSTPNVATTRKILTLVERRENRPDRLPKDGGGRGMQRERTQTLKNHLWLANPPKRRQMLVQVSLKKRKRLPKTMIHLMRRRARSFIGATFVATIQIFPFVCFVHAAFATESTRKKKYFYVTSVTRNITHFVSSLPYHLSPPKSGFARHVRPPLRLPLPTLRFRRDMSLRPLHRAPPEAPPRLLEGHR